MARRGVFLDLDTLHPADLWLDDLRATLDQWVFRSHTRDDECRAQLHGVTVAVSNKVCIDAESLATADRLELICIAATGTDRIDLEAATRRGVTVCNVPRYATPSVVEHVFCLILALTRRLSEYRAAVAAGRWQQAGDFCLQDFPMRELAGKSIGIVGFGELGRGVARVAEALGMDVLIAQRPGMADERPGRMPLDELLAQADVVSLHCPLTDQTRGLIGAERIARMKPDALLINTARGGLVDEQALAEALAQGRLGGAGIDVLDREPPGNDDPLLQLDLPNLIVTPHIAWAAREARQRLVDALAENIRAFFRGEPRNVVAAP